MKVGLFTRYFNDSNAGIGIYSENLLYEMLNRGHRLDLFSTHFDGRIGYFLYTGLDLGLRNLTYDGVDVYHALTPMEAIYLPKEKTVTTFHDLIPWQHKEVNTWYNSGPLSFLTKEIGGKYFELACKCASKSEEIICNSHHTKENVMEHLNVSEEKITVTRLGINPDLEPTRDKSYKNAEYTVGTLSYLDPRKRIGKLVEAFKALGRPDSELLIPSTGSDEERLKEKAGDDERIKFLGYLPEEDKADYLSSLDVFVLPSKLEGYGLTWVEAMACKTPVVSLEDALIPSDVQDRTHIVGKDNLSKLLSERDFNCDIEGNYDFAMKHDWKKCAEETEEVYQRVKNA